jgi:integrase
MQLTLSPLDSFATAAERWLAFRKFDGSGLPQGTKRRHRYVSERTLRSYAQYVRALNRFFGDSPLAEIDLSQLRKFQNARAPEAGPNKINQELGLLIQILKRSGAWLPAMEEAYEPLQYEEGEIPRALSVEEQEQFLTVAASERRWRVIYCYALVVLNTTASSYEMRALRMGDVTRGDAMIYIRWGKNKYRVRSVPLVEDGEWAVGKLVERARDLGARDPHHYLFPLRICSNVWDPARPVSDWGLVKPWNEVRSTAGFPWFQMNALRHTALTRYAEAGMPIEIMQSYAGHISEKMTRHYIQISEAAKRRYARLAANKDPSRRGAPGRADIPGGWGYPHSPPKTSARERG